MADPNQIIDQMDDLLKNSTPETTSKTEETTAPKKEEKEQIITPWEVEADNDTGVDYDKLIKQFGCQKITQELVERFEKVTGQPCHHLIRRGIIYSHREFDRILDYVEKGQKFYLYTGRGPSASSMHMGHMVPFMITKYLQDVFDVPLVIQITDDEKFLYKDQNMELEDYMKMAHENIKDIIAVGFDIEKTFIFTDMQYISSSIGFLSNIRKTQKAITYNQAKGAFGFDESDNIGKVAYPPVQIAPCFPDSFPQIFNKRKDIPCLIPCAIDQDPYFRLGRDISKPLGFEKAALIHSIFFPALQGPGSKMSSSNPNSNIELTDTMNQIKKKINKFAFSGGQATKELHEQLGGRTDKDISYQYLTFFLDDDEKLKQIHDDYESGKMMSGEIKKEIIEVLQKIVGEFQERRAKVTDQDVEDFCKIRKLKFDYDPPKVDDKKGKKKDKKRGGMTKEDKAKRAEKAAAAQAAKN